MADLPSVTVIAVTGVDPEGHREAIIRTREALPFPVTWNLKVVPGMTLAQYSTFMVKELHALVKTDFALTVQSDGYAINSRKWTDEFFDFDYCGAPFPHGETGNGGFALRSRKYMEVSSRLPEPTMAEDAWICQYHRKFMEDAGIRFAPLDLAHQFSHEHDVARHPGWRLQDSFGFHGRWHIKQS